MTGMKTNHAGIDQYRMYIHGEWVESTSANHVEVENPANEEIVATVPAGTADDAKRALESAQSAQPAWAQLPAVQRGLILQRLAALLRERREHFARLLTREQGKPYRLALDEVDATVDYINFPAQGARRIEGDILPSDNPDEHICIHKVPFGVTVGLAAWNFPLALAGRKLGPALTAGNAMVVKPPTVTPTAVLELGALATAAGVPPGILNIVTGSGRTIGAELVSNPITRLVTMTGSVPTGQELYRLAARNITALRLELGGKAPFIVMDDANIDQAVEAAVVSRFLNCGQVCTCNERMYLHDGIYDAFMSRFLAACSKLRLGDPMDPATDMGPKVSRGELENMEAMVAGALDDGCELALGGRRPTGPQFTRGHWFEPTVLTGATNDMAIVKDEIFGPILPVIRFRTFDEAIALANDSDLGLSAYLFTYDMRRIRRAVLELDCGEVYVNRGLGEQRQGFHNGFKRSGIGGEDGRYGMENYLQKKTFYVNFQEAYGSRC